MLPGVLLLPNGALPACNRPSGNKLGSMRWCICVRVPSAFLACAFEHHALKGAIGTALPTGTLPKERCSSKNRGVFKTRFWLGKCTCEAVERCSVVFGFFADNCSPRRQESPVGLPQE